MNSVFWAAGGLVVGAIIAWLVASIRASGRNQARLTDAENRAGAAEGRAAVLQTDLARHQSELSETRRGLSAERDARVKAETQLAETVRRLDEERKLLEDAKSKLTDAFKSIAGDTLDASTRRFLELANETFKKVVSEARGDLGKRQEAIQGLVKPLAESLKQLQEHVRTVEKDRHSAYTGLTEQVKHLSAVHQELQRQTGNLARSLSSPRGVGTWGQMTLRRVIELAGMSEYCDFDLEVSVSTTDGRLRPDCLIRLPGDRNVIIDAKASIEDYHKAVAAETEDQRKAALAQHARRIRSHVHALRAKAYWEQFDNAPELVVMFIPGESFFAAAVENDPQLMEDAMKDRIVLATPTTLIALLLGLAFDWRQEQLARNAREISELGKDLYDRMRTLAEHLTGVGRGLSGANEAYNRAVGSIESRVLPAARRFKELGAGTGEEIPALEPVQSALRQPTAGELTDPPDA